MSHRALGDQFDVDELVEKYHDERGDEAWLDPSHASGRCHIASEDLVAWARTKGHDAEMVERLDTPGFNGEHMAARIGPHVVDPTSAQLEHSYGMSYEIVDHDPEQHPPSTGWYGAKVPPNRAPRSLGQPKWPAAKAWDDLPEHEQHAMAKPNDWIKW